MSGVAWSDIDQDIRDKVVLRLKSLRMETIREKSLFGDITMQSTHVINGLLDMLDFYIHLLHDFVDDMSMVKPCKGEVYHRQMIISVLIDTMQATKIQENNSVDRGFPELANRLHKIADAFIVAIFIVGKY